MSSIKRVLLIGIDSLIFNRTNMGGYQLDVCPTLKKLSDEGINCVNNYSHSGPTQFSMPSVFTSTYPLDYNGYDRGIIDRPNSLAEVLSQEGFKTFGYLPDPWISELGGYNRGFDNTVDCYDLDLVWSNASIYIDYFNERLANGYISRKEWESLFLDHVTKLLDQTKVYCQKSIHESGHFNNDEKYKDIYKYDYTNILESIPDNINNFKDALNALDSFSDLYSFPRKIKPIFHKNFTSADWMVDGILERLDNEKCSKTMSFVFLQDLHELNTCHKYGSYLKVYANKLLSSIPGSGRYRRIFKYFSKGYRSSTKSILYDASLKYIDNSLDRLIQGLKNKAMLDETLIVIFSDHGDSMENGSDIVASFNEDYLKVPMIFWTSDMESRNISAVTSLIDLAPTILDLLDIEKPDTYKGISVFDKRIISRKYILHENVGRGPCDILNKTMHIGLRDSNSVLWTPESDGISTSSLKIIADRARDVKKGCSKFL